MPEPLVSIIIPVYNRADLIGETLDSVLAQTYENWECIVVDDSSTDNTKEVVQQYVDKDPRFILADRPDNHKPGGNGARNYGFEISKGEYIQWFDSDDLMKENFLHEKIKILNNNSDYQSVVSRFTSFENEKIYDKQLVFKNQYDHLYENTITARIHVNTPGIIYRKSFLENSKETFNETLKQAQEYEFINRVFIKHPHKSFILDKSLCYVRRDTKGSISFKNRDLSYEANEQLIRLLIKEKKLTKQLEKFYFRKHKAIISESIRNAQLDEVVKYRQLVESYLKHRQKHIKLARFKLNLELIKIIPVDNFFLVYRDTPFTLFFSKNKRRIYKTLFVRGYLLQKLTNRKSSFQKA